MKYLITIYVVASLLCGGYLNGINQFMPADYKMSNWEISWKAISWPFSVGQIVAGWQMGGVETSVETEEEFDVPTAPYVHEGELSV